MKRFRIYTQQVDMGVYSGKTEREALDKYAKDVGYSGYDELVSRFGRPQVEEL